MRIGIVPLLDSAGGGVRQYSLAVLDALDRWALEAGRGRFTAFVEDASHPAVAALRASRWRIQPLEPADDAGPDDNGGPARRRELLRSLARISPSAGDPRVRFRAANSRWLCRSGVELMLYPVPNALAFETGLPYVMAIHDLQHRLQPEFPEVSAGGQWEAREYLHRNGCRYASLLVADSEIGKEDILEAYSGEGVTPDRIRVVPFAPFSRLAAGTSAEDAQRVRAAHRLPESYLFYPAHFWPHKNHLRIVEALARLRAERKLDIPIVFCGAYPDAICRQTFDDVMALAARAGLESQVRYLGYVSDEDIAGLYAGATALIMPTFFGPTNIPVVEAWAFGCPVLTSDIRGVRDQAGDAALLVDPRSVESIADGILRICRDERLRRELAERGRKRAAAHTTEEFQARWIDVVREAKERARAERSGRIALLRFARRAGARPDGSLPGRLHGPDISTSPAERILGVDGRAPSDVLFLGEGWYPFETAAGESFRWVANDAEVVVSRPSGLRRRLSVEIEAGPGIGRRSFELHVLGPEGRRVASARVRRRQTVEIDLPIAPGPDTVFRLHVEGGGTLLGNDPRVLNFRIFRLGWSEPTGAPPPSSGRRARSTEAA